MEVEVVWSVIILLGCGLAFTLYCVIYILRLAHMETQNGSKEESISKQQEAESGECNGKESEEWW